MISLFILPVDKSKKVWYNSIIEMRERPTSENTLEVDTMLKKNLRDHASAQCHVEIENDRVVFVSYTTPVIFITHENGKRCVECTGTYSQTTRKQIGWFCKEYLPGLCYHDMKTIVGAGAVEM